MLSLLISLMVATDVGDGLPLKAPMAVGMSSARLAKIDHVVERGIAAGGYPGASVVVGRRGAAVMEKGFGRLSWSSSSPAVTADRTIYDLASLTKVVGTTSALMVLFDQGKISLDDEAEHVGAEVGVFVAAAGIADERRFDNLVARFRRRMR